MTNFNTYQSPFTWRYGTDEMRHIFSEENKYRIWRKIWVSLARTQYEAGLVSKKELEDLEKNQDNFNIEEILERESQTHHDLVAAIGEFAGKAKIGGGKIHLGATSMDIVDNTDAIRIQQALGIIEQNISSNLSLFAEKIDAFADLVCMGYTHLQPAEPTTVGYRLSFYAQDLLSDYQLLQFVKSEIKTKGMKGAVGTAAGYTAVLKNTGMDALEMEEKVMKQLGLEASLISTQVYTRKYDYFVLVLINSIASTFAKFAADIRILQSPSIGEWAEPFGKTQIGSSAMPFKKNPINSEKICSLARYISALPQVVLDNASHSYLERTLDDSANKRIVIPEAFLAIDEILTVAQKLLTGLVIYEKKIIFNVSQYAPFAATELILMESVKQGANRQIIHELLRAISLKAWGEIQNGKPNPMVNLLIKNEELKKYLPEKKIQELLDVEHHVGTAPQRARILSVKIKQTLKDVVK